MPMRFAVQHLPNASDEDEIPELPMEIDDAVLSKMVENAYLTENEVTDPVKVIRMIELFLQNILGEPQPLMRLRQ
jgi:hypothetical protein